MRTDDLIDTLSASAGPVRPAPIGRLVWPVLAGAAVSLAVLLVWLGLRPMAEAVHSMSFWMKAGYSAALALAGGVAVWGLARPAGSAGRGPLIAAAALFVILCLAAARLIPASPAQATKLWLGDTWNLCPLRILVLSAPILIAALLGLRRLAPTRPRAAGAAAGLLAGGLGATLYGLYCQETAAPFVAAWYTFGIAACAVIGALLGPRLLRW
jgi:hypothetical protein